MGNRNRQPDNGRVRKPNQNGGQRPANNNGGGPRGQTPGRGPRAGGSARRPPPPNFQAAKEFYDNQNPRPRGRGNLRNRGGSGRHGGRNRGGNHLESFAVTEWTENNCPSDGDRGAEKLVDFLSKKAHATIEEVCLTLKSPGCQRHYSSSFSGLLSFQVKPSKRRRRYSSLATTANG